MSPIRKFIKLPMEVLMDARLSHRDMRVLMSLYSFGSRPGDHVWPSRDTLAELSRCHLPHVSTSLTRLETFGWIARKQNGRGPNSYELLCPTVPETVTPEATGGLPTVTETVTPDIVPGGPTVTKTVIHSYQNGNATVTESVITLLNRPRTDQRTDHTSPASSCAPAREEPPPMDEGDLPAGEPVDTTVPGEADGMPGDDPALPDDPGTDPPPTDDPPTCGRKPRTRITADWQPDDACRERLMQLGHAAELVDTLVPEFVQYWRDRGERKASWGSTFMHWVKRVAADQGALPTGTAVGTGVRPPRGRQARIEQNNIEAGLQFLSGEGGL